MSDNQILKNIIISLLDGEEVNKSDLSKAFGIPRGTINNRLKKGLNYNEALKK